MPVFAPGAWAGVNDAFLIARQREQEQQQLAERRQRMTRDAWDMQSAQEDRQRTMRARGDAGSALYGMMPPQARMPAPQPPGPQPPMPGTPSAPMQTPGGGGQRMLAPGVPQFSAPPQGPAPQGVPMAPPGMRGAPTQPDERAMAIMRCRQDLQALDRELANPRLDAQQRAILTGEKSKAQDALAKLTGQPAPYRTVPQPDAAGPQGAPGGPSPMAPPPVSGGAPGGQPQSLLMQIIGQAKANGVPPDRLMDVVDTLNPVLKSQLQEELAQMRATQIGNSAEAKALSLRLQELEHERRVARDQRTGDQGDRRLDQNAERITLAKQRAEAGQAPTSSELQDPETARIFYDIYKRTGKTPPFAWGKAGETDRTAWMQAVKRLSKEDGQTGGEIAGGQADAKAAGASLTQITKDITAIKPFKVMLDKNVDVAIDLGHKVQSSNSAWANKPIQWLKKNGSSDPNLREFLAQIQIVQTESARVLNNPRLTGQLTDSARHEMQDIVDGKMPLADLERVLQRIKQDGTNRVKAMEDEAAGLRARTSGKQPAAGGGDEDAQAIAWAKANPKDPRAAKILALHPGQ